MPIMSWLCCALKPSLCCQSVLSWGVLGGRHSHLLPGAQPPQLGHPHGRHLCRLQLSALFHPLPQGDSLLLMSHVSCPCTSVLQPRSHTERRALSCYCMWYQADSPGVAHVQVIKLSDTVQAFPRSVVCCVHGAAPKFLEYGDAKSKLRAGMMPKHPCLASLSCTGTLQLCAVIIAMLLMLR